MRQQRRLEIEEMQTQSQAGLLSVAQYLKEINSNSESTNSILKSIVAFEKTKQEESMKHMSLNDIADFILELNVHHSLTNKTLLSINKSLDLIGEHLLFEDKQINSVSVGTTGIERTNELLTDILEVITEESQPQGRERQEKGEKAGGMFSGKGWLAGKLLGGGIYGMLGGMFANPIKNTLGDITETVKLLAEHMKVLSNLGEGLVQGMEAFGKNMANLEKFVNSIDNKTNKQFDRFVTIYERLVSKDSSMMVRQASIELSKFNKIIDEMLSKEPKLSKLEKTFQSLGGGKQSLSTGKMFVYIAGGIAAITLSLIGLNFVQWSSVLKLITFMGALALTTKLFNSKMTVPNMQFDKSGLIGLSVALATITLVLVAMSYISFAAPIMLIGFLTSLALTTKVVGSGRGGGSIGAMGKMALGIGILVLAIAAIGEVSFSEAGLLIGFIATMGLVIGATNILINKTAGKGGKIGGGGMVGFAFGIGILVLAVAAIGELDWIAAGQLIIFITLLGLAMALPALVSGGKAKGFQSSGMLGFAFGLGILILAIEAAGELDWKNGLYIIGFVAGLGLAMRSFTKDKGLGFGIFSAGLIGIVGAFWLISKVDLSLGQSILILGTTLGFVFIFKMISKALPQIMTGTIAIAALTGGILAMSLGLFAISKLNIDFIQILKFIGALALLTLTVAAISFAAPFAAAGIIVIAGMGVSLLLAAGALFAISKLTYTGIPEFVIALKDVIIGIAGLTLYALSAVIAAPLIAVVMTTTLLAAGALFAISLLSFDNTNIQNFNSGIRQIIDGYNNLGLVELAKADAKALMLVPILGTTLLATGVLMAMSFLKFNPNSFVAFSVGVSTIVKTYDKFGVVQLGKVALKAAALVPVFGTTFLAAITFKKIGELEVSESKMEAFGNTLGIFLTKTVDAVNQSSSKLKEIQPGLKSLTGLVGVAGQLVDVIIAFSNMQYNEYVVVNGELKLKAVHPITEDQLKAVGPGLGRLIQGLLGPLAILSSNDSEWDFGNNVKIKNPFKGGLFGDNNKGAKRIKTIGESFLPLVQNIAEFKNLGISQDKASLNNFTTSLTETISTIVKVIGETEKINESQSAKGIKTMEMLFNTLNLVNYQNIDNITKSNIALITEVSDEKKWNSIVKNINNADKALKNMVTSINKIDMQKITALDRTLRLMVEKNNYENLVNVLQELQELIGMLTETQTRITEQLTNNVESAANIPTNTTVSLVNNKKQETEETTITPENIPEILNSLKDISDKLSGVNTKLSGTIKVETTKNSNQI